jgi:hypothetical protein
MHGPAEEGVGMRDHRGVPGIVFTSIEQCLDPAGWAEQLDAADQSSCRG